MRQGAAAFLRKNNVGWVVIEEASAAASLQDLTIDALHLQLLQRSGGFALYAPAAAND
jgi:hypothetical protein